MSEYHDYDLQGIATRYGLTEHPIFEIADYFDPTFRTSRGQYLQISEVAGLAASGVIGA